MAHYEFPKVLGLSQLTYAGNWRVERQRIVAGPGARLRLRFYAQDAYLVIGGKGRVQVLLDGKPEPTIQRHRGQALHGRGAVEAEGHVTRAALLARRRGLRLHVRLELSAPIPARGRDRPAHLARGDSA